MHIRSFATEHVPHRPSSPPATYEASQDAIPVKHPDAPDRKRQRSILTEHAGDRLMSACCASHSDRRASRSNPHLVSMKPLIAVYLMVSACAAADLTGNWLVATPNGDGTMRRTYLHLKEQDGGITGTVRSTLHLFTIDKSSGGPDNFTFTAAMPILGSERRVTYQGRGAGEQLRLRGVGLTRQANGLTTAPGCQQLG